MNKVLISVILILFLLACKQPSNNKLPEVIDTSFNVESYREKGLDIALYAQGAIGGALQSAMKEGGVPNALSVCNLQALSITDSLSQHHNVVLQRVSDKNRNPQNKASELDLIVLNKFKEMMAKDEPALPIVEKQNGKVVFYHAILANTNCMKCHGVVGVDILEAHNNEILSLYPNDLAIGYEPGKLRGAFKITFN